MLGQIFDAYSFARIDGGRGLEGSAAKRLCPRLKYSCCPGF